MSKEKLVRLFIYPADVRAITGRSDSYSRQLLRRIRKARRKKPHSLITVYEFCEYLQLELEHIIPFLT